MSHCGPKGVVILSFIRNPQAVLLIAACRTPKPDRLLDERCVKFAVFARGAVYDRIHRRGTVVPRQPTTFARYAVAVCAVAGAFGLRYSLGDSLENRLAFAFFTPATLVAAWYGGLGPGLLAALAGLLLGDYFFLPPHHAWAPLGEAERTVIGVFATTNTLIVLLFAHLHSRLRNLEDDLQKLNAGEDGGRRESAPVIVEPGDPQVGTPGQVRPL
jgi:hypothetical protein